MYETFCVSLIIIMTFFVGFLYEKLHELYTLKFARYEYAIIECKMASFVCLKKVYCIACIVSSECICYKHNLGRLPIAPIENDNLSLFNSLL